MEIHGVPCISMDAHEYPWMSVFLGDLRHLETGSLTLEPVRSFCYIYYVYELTMVHF